MRFVTVPPDSAPRRKLRLEDVPAEPNTTIVPKGGVPIQPQANLHEVPAEPPDAAPGFFMQASDVASKRFTNNLLATPSTIFDTISFPRRALHSLATEGELPSFRVTGNPTVQGLVSNVRGVESFLTGGSFEEGRRQARENIDIAEGRNAKARPGATAVGEVSGDILSLVLARRAGGFGTKRQAEVVKKAATEAQEAIKFGFRNYFKTGTKFPKDAVGRAAKKATEVGLEAAALTAVQGGDSLAAGALAAGLQVGGSAALKGLKSPLAWGTLAAATVSWQAAKELFPGGDDFLVDSAQEVIRKAILFAGLGGLAATIGAGRFKGAQIGPPFIRNLHDNFPNLADSLNTIIRGIPISIISDQFQSDLKSDKPVIGPVMDALSTNIEAFTQNELKRINGAVMSGKLRTELSRMLKDKEFAAKVGF